MKSMAAGGAVTFGLVVIIVLGIIGSFERSCVGVFYFNRMAVAWHMMAYSALWCGFLGVMLQIGSVNQWMRRRFIDGLKGLGAISGTWDAGGVAVINDLIERTIQRFSLMAWSVIPCMFCYLILLTLFPERCVTLEERIAVVLLPFCTLGELFFGYIRTDSSVNTLSRAAEMRKEVGVGSALRRNSHRVGTGSQEDSSG